MSHRPINIKATGRTVRSNHRAQLNWFRCTSVAQSLEHWDQEIESGRHLDSFKAFESTTRRRTQPEVVGE